MRSRINSMAVAIVVLAGAAQALAAEPPKCPDPKPVAKQTVGKESSKQKAGDKSAASDAGAAIEQLAASNPEIQKLLGKAAAGTAAAGSDGDAGVRSFGKGRAGKAKAQANAAKQAPADDAEDKLLAAINAFEGEQGQAVMAEGEQAGHAGAAVDASGEPVKAAQRMSRGSQAKQSIVFRSNRADRIAKQRNERIARSEKSARLEREKSASAGPGSSAAGNSPVAGEKSGSAPAAKGQPGKSQKIPKAPAPKSSAAKGSVKGIKAAKPGSAAQAAVAAQAQPSGKEVRH